MEISDTTASARVPDRWATSDQNFEKVLPHVENVETIDARERQKTLTEVRRCNCAKILRRQTKSLWTSTWSLSWSDSTTSHHLKTCQYWNPYQEVWTTKLSVSHVNLLAAMALSASIRISKQAGIFSISPSLTLRGVVNETSPAFALLENLSKLYEHFPQPYDHHVRMSTLEKQTSLVNRSLLRLLKEGAVSPYEVDENGRTLLHRALSCYSDIGPPAVVAEVLAFRELIYTLLDAGVAINEVDLAGETAFGYLISHIRFYTNCYSRKYTLCEFLANKGAEINDILLTSSSVTSFRIAVEMQNVAMLEPWQDVTQCGPLSLAVSRRSEQDVIRILRAKPTSTHELNRRKQNPLHLACCWPRGIQLLLDVGANYLVHQTDVCGGLPIMYSTNFNCLDAAQLLVNAGSALSSPGWMGNSDEVLQIIPDAHTIPSFLLSALQERRRKLFELAKLTLPAEAWADLDVPTDRLLDERAAEIQRILVDADIEIPKSISVPQMHATVYHSSIRTAEQADQLWDAGFRDIDSCDESGDTPLMISRTSEYCQWLLQHGADPHREIQYINEYREDKENRVAGRTALHCIAYHHGVNIVDTWSRDLLPALQLIDESSLTLEGLLVESNWYDDCYCACSSNGCTPFTILLKTINRQARFLTRVSKRPLDIRRILVQHLETQGHPASSVSVRSKIVEDVIRIETFEALRLRHTCCNAYGWTARRRYTTEEVQEIHEEWEELLSKHEDLVSEFCHMFEELGGTLTSFLGGYWQTRMDEVLEEGKPLDEEQRRRLREIGVVLEEASEESENDCLNEGVTYEDEIEGSSEEGEEGEAGWLTMSNPSNKPYPSMETEPSSATMKITTNSSIPEVALLPTQP